MNKYFIVVLFFFPVSIFSQIESIKFKHLNTDNGLSHNTVLSIYRDSYGYLWVGTGNSGINKYDGSSFKVYKYNPKDTNTLNNNTIHQISEDENHNLWVATKSGLNIYDREHDLFTRIPALAGNYINGFYIHKNGNFYLTNESSLILYNPRDKQRTYRVPDLYYRRNCIS